jgi:hypothetical protein
MRTIVILFFALAAACRHSSPPDPTALAATPEQQRLWREAAARGVALDGIEKPDQPLAVRRRSTVPNTPSPTKPIAIPDGMTDGLRIIDGPPSSYAGDARVTRVDGDRIDLAFGNGSSMAFLARLHGRPLRAAAGETVRVDYRVDEERFRVPMLFAIRTARGDGVAMVADASDAPVSISIPLFELTAQQRGTSVEVRVGSVAEVLAPGAAATLGPFRVTVIGTAAHSQEERPFIEGQRFGMTLMVWTVE